MIKSEYGSTAIKGDEAEIMSDATCMLRALRKTFAKEHGVKGAEERIHRIIKMSKMSEGEIDEMVIELLIKMMGGVSGDGSKN